MPVLSWCVQQLLISVSANYVFACCKFYQSCNAQASKTKLASNYPDIILMDKKGKHALLSESVLHVTRLQEPEFFCKQMTLHFYRFVV
jgi:hypothetical protein